MSNAERFAEWIVANKDKKGTPDFEKVAAADDGAYDMLQDAVSGKYGEQIMNACTDMYSDIASDNGYHHDDDFEKIYDRMIDNIQDDYGKKESKKTKSATY